MKFTKMHGLGNDYVFVNCFEEQIADRSALAKRISHRHFGVGSDGLICICPSEGADFRMDMYNADGSPSQMCGNGIRCVGKYVYDNGMTAKERITVESGGETRALKLNVKDGRVQTVQVNMGTPILQPRLIPMDTDGVDFINRPITVLGREYHITAVSMGNPHAVLFLPNVDALDLPMIGPDFERHPLFPERVNTEFVQVIDRQTLKMRVWERGSGETLACGTGASASVVAGVLNGLCDEIVTVRLLGGDLLIHWDREGTGEVYMTGSAETVFVGEYFG